MIKTSAIRAYADRLAVRKMRMCLSAQPCRIREQDETITTLQEHIRLLRAKQDTDAHPAAEQPSRDSPARVDGGGRSSSAAASSSVSRVRTAGVPELEMCVLFDCATSSIDASLRLATVAAQARLIGH